ncbi:leucine-rich repeat protein 1 (LRRP1) [Trypanosoma theileri]|uniref:Leucine-rich repeat protein 1 (LRRP1) n=1 Tax=Trypanosoma theileri TaxID=67003 RepID=A0A1X0P4M6_9TRYP|nr:leucine-rich repeat protein 1 (LRRP1) [Trypanosoma theileri]ORC91886.1 leucine-rich repeat protein 1 (LRRP1) [Trypanosoma theileri]
MLPSIKKEERFFLICRDPEINYASSRTENTVKTITLPRRIVNDQNKYCLRIIDSFGEDESPNGNGSVPESFGHLPTLRSLNLSATAVSDRNLAEFSASRSLVKIILEDCKCITSVSPLSSIITLEEIKICGCSQVSNVGILGVLPSLRILDASKTAVTNDGLKGLEETSTLVKIILEECGGLKGVNTLSSIKPLEEISLRGCNQLKNIGGLGLLTKLQILDVSKTPLRDSDLMGLGASRSLQKILLLDCKSLTSVNTLTSIRTLKEIFLAGCLRLKTIGVLGTLPVLRSVDVSRSSITDDGLEGLSESPSLLNIILEDCNSLTDVSILSSIITLEEIKLRGCIRVTTLGALGLLPMLRILDGSKTSVTDDGLEGLSRSRSLVKIILEECDSLTNVSILSSIVTLEEIKLRGCIRVTTLGSLGLLPMLVILDASKTAVTDTGIRGLGASHSLSKIFLEDCGNLTSVLTLSSIYSLEEMYIQGCLRMTSIGILGTLPTLRLLDASNTPVTDDGLKGLGDSCSLSKISLEDCKNLTNVASLASIHTLTEINLRGCTGLMNLGTLPLHREVMSPLHLREIRMTREM